jgi:hypothetical protein
VTTERTLVIEAPAGSRRRGFESYTVQDLLLAPHIRFRRERWVTPDVSGNAARPAAVAIVLPRFPVFL